MTEMLSNEVQLSPTEQTIKNLTEYTEMLRRQVADAMANPVQTGSVHENRCYSTDERHSRSIRSMGNHVMYATPVTEPALTSHSVSGIEVTPYINDENWFHYAECRPNHLSKNVSPTDFDFATSVAAKAICNGDAKKGIRPCPVKDECLNEAIDKGIGIGIWGGKTPKERNEIRDERTGKARHSVV